MKRREWHKISRLRKHTMHVFSPSMCAYNASYRDGTPATSHGDCTSLDNASGGTCLKGILILVILPKSVTFVIQIFYKT